MVIHLIEVGIECDDVDTDGLAALAVIVEAVGLNPNVDHVETFVGSSETGNPVLVATLQANKGSHDH